MMTDEPKGDLENEDIASTKLIQLKMTERQYEIATYPLKSNLQIIAPVGTGKTRSLVYRMIYWVNQGIEPEKILVVSLSNRSVIALRNQMQEICGPDIPERINFHTFSSLCRGLLQKYGEMVGINESCQVIDANDQKYIVGSLLNVKTPALHASIARKIKQGQINIKKLVPEYLDAFEKYKEIMTDLNLLDFEDIFDKSIELMEKNPECLSDFNMILVDEYQDMNPKIYYIINLLGKKASSLTIAGDPDQSIWGFSGSDYHTLLGNLENDSRKSDIKRITLEENLRSTPEILTLASTILNPKPLEINIKHVVKSGSLPFLKHFEDRETEKNWVIEEIHKIMTTRQEKSTGYIAVLARTNAELIEFARRLKLRGLNVHFSGTDPLWNHEEVRNLMDYLKVIDSTNNRFSLLRLLGTVKRVGRSAQIKIYKEAKANDIPVWDFIHDYKWSPSVKPGVEKLIETIENARKIVESNPYDGGTICEALNSIIEATELENELINKDPRQYPQKWRHIKSLFSIIQSTTKNLESPITIERSNGNSEPYPKSLNFFLNSVNNFESLPNVKQVLLSTIHSTKGLEFDVVFLTGMNDDTLPGPKALNNWNFLQEERRLLYVAITRARKQLYITVPHSNQYGTAHSLTSRFLNTSRAMKYVNAGPMKMETTLQNVPNIPIKAIVQTGAHTKLEDRLVTAREYHTNVRNINRIAKYPALDIVLKNLKNISRGFRRA